MLREFPVNGEGEHTAQGEKQNVGYLGAGAMLEKIG